MFKKNCLEGSNFHIIYIIIYLICLFQSILYVFLFNNNFLNLISHYTSHNEIGVDYFGLLVRNFDSPISTSHPYPPLSYLFYKILSIISFADSTYIYEKHQLIVFIFMILFLLLISFVIIKDNFFENNYRFLNLFIILSLLNYNVLGTIFTGNLSLVTLPLCLFYYYYYNSKNKFLHELSLIFLSIAFGLKLTPIIFCFTLLWNKNYKSFLRLMIYSLICLFFPLLLFKNGNGLFENAKSILNAIIGYSNYQYGFFGGGELFWYFSKVLNHFNINLDITIFSQIVSKVLLCLLIICSFISENRTIKISALVYSHILIGPMLTHTGVIFVIPLLAMIIDKNKNLYLFLLFVFTNVPMRFLISGMFKGHLEYIVHSMFLEIIIYLIYIYILFDTLKYLKSKYS